MKFHYWTGKCVELFRSRYPFTRDSNQQKATNAAHLLKQNAFFFAKEFHSPPLLLMPFIWCICTFALSLYHTIHVWSQVFMIDVGQTGFWSASTKRENFPLQFVANLNRMSGQNARHKSYRHTTRIQPSNIHSTRTHCVCCCRSYIIHCAKDQANR